MKVFSVAPAYNVSQPIGSQQALPGRAPDSFQRLNFAGTHELNASDLTPEQKEKLLTSVLQRSTQSLIADAKKREWVDLDASDEETIKKLFNLFKTSIEQWDGTKITDKTTPADIKQSAQLILIGMAGVEKRALDDAKQYGISHFSIRERDNFLEMNREDINKAKIGDLIRSFIDPPKIHEIKNALAKHFNPKETRYINVRNYVAKEQAAMEDFQEPEDKVDLNDPEAVWRDFYSTVNNYVSSMAQNYDIEGFRGFIDTEDEVIQTIRETLVKELKQPPEAGWLTLIDAYYKK